MPTSADRTVISVYLRKTEREYLRKLATLRGEHISTLLKTLAFAQIEALHARGKLFPGQHDPT